MTSQLSPTPIFKAFDNNGFPLAFGLLTTYQAGTLTKQATYVDSTQTTQNTNPIQLNFRGECAIWLDPTLTYKFALTDQFGNTIPGWPVDNIPGGFGSAPLSVNLIPNPTNTFTLGSPTNSWAQIYLGANAAPAYDPVSGNIAYYARTAAEISAGVTPTNYAYAPGDVRRQGVTGSGDETAKLQNALNVGGWVWIPPGLTVTANSNLNIVKSNTTFQIDGVLVLPTSRIIAYAVNSFHVIGDGTVQSSNINNTDTVPVSSGWQGLGIVNFGGNSTTLATDFLWNGVELAGGFNGTPGTISIINLDVRRGIAMQYCTTARVRRSRVHGSIAEAIWYGGQAGSPVSSDIEIADNHVYNNNHDCISPAVQAIVTFRTHGNIMWNSLNGIESSIGVHEGNYAFNMIGSGYGFGGSNPNPGIDPVVFRNNVGRNNGLGAGGAVDFSFQGATTQQGNLIVQNNQSYNSGGAAFFVSFMNNVLFTGNQANGWGVAAAGSAFAFANSNYIYVDDNHCYDEGANSNGGFNLSTLIQGIIGANNTTRGVAIPYPLDTTSGTLMKPAPVPCFSTPGTASLTGSTTPTTISACTVAANSMGRTGGIVITAGGTTTGTAGSKTINIQLGGSTATQLVIPAASTAAWYVRVTIIGQSSTSAQLAIGEAIFNGAPQANVGSLSVNSAANLVATVQGTLANAADTITVYSFRVEPFIGLTP